MIEAKIIKDSISEDNIRITTFQLKYPRFIHSEVNTHRAFSRNASSSRAIPIMKMIKQIWHEPAMPVYWGSNKPGMQAGKELVDFQLFFAQSVWKLAGKVACGMAYLLNRVGLHKQISNRILEPWQHIHVVLTSTDFENFFNLRDHEAAQPEIRELAVDMRRALENSVPSLLQEGEYHLPYVEYSEQLTLEDALKCSAARCARVSYMKHDGQKPSLADDLELYNQLVTRPYTDKRGFYYDENSPIHASPCEHQATPVIQKNYRSGNFRGWLQNRQVVEKQNARRD